MDFLILHGHGGYAGIHWQQWLADELIAAGHTVAMPTLPNADDPDRFDWIEVAGKELALLDQANLTIIGHSIGATTALDLLENFEGQAHFVSVSGFSHDYGAELNGAFLRARDVDLDKAKSHIAKTTIFYGDNDPYVPQKTLQDLADALDVEPLVIPDGGHLNTEAGFTKFPLLLDVLSN